MVQTLARLPHATRDVIFCSAQCLFIPILNVFLIIQIIQTLFRRRLFAASILGCLSQLSILLIVTGPPEVVCNMRATRWGGIWPPAIFKTLRISFDICSNFQRIKNKVYILIIFKKSYWNFSLSCLLIISLQDLSWDTWSDRNIRKWLVFQPQICWNCQLGR